MFFVLPLSNFHVSEIIFMLNVTNKNHFQMFSSFDGEACYELLDFYCCLFVFIFDIVEVKKNMN